MAWQDPTTINWSNGAVELLAYINAVTLGWASRMVLIGIYIIVLSGYYKARDDFSGGMAAAGVSVFIVAFFGFLLNPSFVDWITLAITIGLAFIGAAIVLVEKNSGTA